MIGCNAFSVVDVLSSRSLESNRTAGMAYSDVSTRTASSTAKPRAIRVKNVDVGATRKCRLMSYTRGTGTIVMQCTAAMTSTFAPVSDAKAQTLREFMFRASCGSQFMFSISLLLLPRPAPVPCPNAKSAATCLPSTLSNFWTSASSNAPIQRDCTRAQTIPFKCR